MTERTLANRIAEPFWGLARATPTVVDRIVTWADPVRGVKRMRARATMATASTFFGQGGYTGARTDRPSLKNWNPASGSADRDTLGDLAKLRSRSRDAHRNHPIASGATSTNVMNVVGTGLKPKSQLDREFLGLSEDEAQTWERQAERIFEYHRDRLDIESELTFAAMQGLTLRSTLESGDILPIKRFVPRAGDLLATRVQLVEADRISNPRGRPDKREIAAGVEIDRNGRPIAYHVADNHPGDIWSSAALHWERVPVWGKSGRRAKLLYQKLRPGQRRGVPYLAPVLERLKQITRYSEAELAATVVSALFTVFIKHTAGDPADLSLNGYVTDAGATENVDKAGDEADDRELHLGQGSIVDLLEGEEIQTADPARPNESFDPFWVAIVREIGIGIDMPFEVLVKHFQASYSASRAAFLMAWKSFLMRRQWLADGLCRLAWEWTIEEAVARSLLEAPGFFDDPLRRQAWLSVEWVGDAPGQIDELKETKAAELRVDLGVSTLSEETARLTGGDWERKHPQRAREVRMRREAGLEKEPAAEAGPGMADEDPDEADRREVAA